MCDYRRIERVLYPCPVINCDDYEKYPLVTGRDWYWMERESLQLNTYVCAFSDTYEKKAEGPKAVIFPSAGKEE